MKNKPLFLILILGAVLRLGFLGKIPAGISPDEVSQGYTAYSLLKTGKDEWGIPWPLTSFRSFADYKAPLQTYLMIPSVALFGLSEFSVRLPSAFFGILAIYTAYLLASHLFNRKAAILAALVLAISPWHLQFSRTALEVNLSSFLFPLGFYLFLIGLKKPKYLLATALIWGLNLYSYHAAKLFTPLFAALLTLVYKPKNKTVPIVIFLFFFIPAYYTSFFGSAGARGNDLLITNLSLEQVKEISAAQFLSPLNKISPQVSRLFHNKVIFILDKFTENYLSYFNPSFWFTEGGRETTYSVIPGQGLLYLWQFPFIALGLIGLLSIKSKKTKIILFSWLLLAALPAALTKEGYRPNRAGSFLVVWEIIIALGLFKVCNLKFKLKYHLLIVIAVVSLVFYLEDYALASAIKFPNSLSYGYRDLMDKLIPLEEEYHSIIIDRGNQSQAFVAFYKQLDPVVFQHHSQAWWQRFRGANLLYLDMLDDYSLGKYRFKTIHLPDDLTPQTLLILPAKTLDHRYLPKVLDTVYYPNREPFLYLLKANEAI